MKNERVNGSISASEIERLVSDLEAPLEAHERRYPGDPARRQPVQTVVGGAHLFKRDTAAKLGTIALQYLRDFAGSVEAFAAVLGREKAGPLEVDVRERVCSKLEQEPVEDFRIDFEDGFGYRSDGEEDAAALDAAAETAAGLEMGSLPPFLGIRIKPLTRETAGRALRTLDLYTSRLVEISGGRLPERFVVMLPKIVRAEQVAALAGALERLERNLALPRESISIELMIETPQSLIRADGRMAPLELVEAAAGRCVSVHLGAYDLTAAATVTAAHQNLAHTLCDTARQILKLTLSETGVLLSDGATNVLPVPLHRPATEAMLSADQRAANRVAIHAAWRRHYVDTRRSLAQGFYQGWDLHPAQLVSRYAAVYAFFLEGLEAAAQRLERFVSEAARATLTRGVFDDAATGQGLLNFFLRGLACGALTPEEVARSGLTPEELETRSFVRVLDGRRG